MSKRILALLLGFLLLLPGIPVASATDAADLSADTAVTGTGFEDLAFLTDKDQKLYVTGENVTLTLTNGQGIGSLYLLFDLEVSPYTVTTGEQSFTAGENGYLHEFLDLSAEFGTAPTSVTLQFSGSVSLSEIFVFAPGDVPDFVQKWEHPLEGGTDIVLFSTHGDDDQLYFAGLLPLYAGEQGRRVQVVYLTDHRSGPYATNERTHEILCGLWATGVTAYPVFGAFADFRIDDLEDSYKEYETVYGTTEQDLQAFVVEQIRRFRPLVAVGHDIKGEYGHGMHQVYTDLLIKSLDMTGDAARFPESAEKYGTWELPKLYLHLYEKNTLILDIDSPLDAFGGLSGFQVTQQLGFPCHETQQVHGFYKWLHGKDNEITKASQIEKYNPAYYGLYHSTVGLDTGKNDFLENVIPEPQPEPEIPDAEPPDREPGAEPDATLDIRWEIWVLLAVDAVVVGSGILAIVLSRKKNTKKTPEFQK